MLKILTNAQHNCSHELQLVLISEPMSIEAERYNSHDQKAFMLYVITIQQAGKETTVAHHSGIALLCCRC
jgi:hypothetical protein